jgi:hypothetical protein
MKENIEKLLLNIGNRVSADHIAAQGIQLERALLITNQTSRPTYYFLGYRVRRFTKKYYIKKDDKFLKEFSFDNNKNGI